MAKYLLFLLLSISCVLSHPYYKIIDGVECLATDDPSV